MKTCQTGSTRKAVRIVVAAGVALGTAPSFADDIFLNIPGIPGESVSDKHKDEIDVVSFSLQTPPKLCPVIALYKRVDKATPLLQEAAATQKNIGGATFSMAKTGIKSTDYYRVVLSGGVLVTSADQTFSSGDSGGYESITLTATSTMIAYKPMKQDGSLGTEVSRTINCSGGGFGGGGGGGPPTR